MAFFDDFSKHMDKIKKGAQKTAELARMQHQVAVKQSDFEKLFGEIGKLYYSERQRGVQPDATMDELCDKVDALAAEISDLKKKIDELRQVNRCPECGAEQPSANAFCSACGAKLPEKKKEEPVKAPEETPAEEESRDVYIKWPDGSVKEEEKTEETAEEASEEAAEAAQSDSAVEPEAAEETAEAPKEGAHEETHE